MCVLVDSDPRCMGGVLKSDFGLAYMHSEGISEEEGMWLWTIRYEDRERVSFSLRLYDSRFPPEMQAEMPKTL